MKLFAFDFDATLMDSPLPETGKDIWKEKTGYVYPHIGWWGRKESLDTDVFDIKPFRKVKQILVDESSNNNSMIVILTNRQHKLKSSVENILSLNNINVDDINMKKNNFNKGQRILKYLEEYPDIKEINVYDDSDEQINTFIGIIPELPKGVVINIYKATDGNVRLVKSSDRLMKAINEVLKTFPFI